MINYYDLVKSLTSQILPDGERARILNDFAYELGWQPSDYLDDPKVSGFANAHLLVEHGLENTAVISFLKSPRRYSDLNYTERELLLGISYNNLVDWHINIEPGEVTFVFNRTKPPRVVGSYQISRDNFDNLRSEAFEKIIGKRPNPNVPALDHALIRTISYWKRNIPAELGSDIPYESLSALFTAIIFVRAVEDYSKQLSALNKDRDLSNDSIGLLEAANALYAPESTVREVIRQTFLKYSTEEIPIYLFDQAKLKIFDKLDEQTVYSLLSDFYRNKYAPYGYDFSIMSKHALSRIYEHYASILRIEESPQLSLFPPLPEEEINKSFGSIYTPQFIARFFAKYLREHLPPPVFRRLKAADPACGSGIFLRTLLELQCDPIRNGATTEFIIEAFDNVFGIDVDENACQATRLSLALLYLVLVNSFPKNLNIVSHEAIEYYQQHPNLRNSSDVVMANPPFVSLKFQNSEMRTRLSQFMGEYAIGRKDLYLAFLRIGIEMLKPGGYGLFVLPHSFFLSKNASKMRKHLFETSWIRCIADLSAIRVFEDYGSYIILLIFQKKFGSEKKPPIATIVKCQDLVGRALQDVIEGRVIETNFYSVYNLEQKVFGDDEWHILLPTEVAIERKLKTLPTIEDFMYIRQGFVSGADDVFIVQGDTIPKGEKEIYAPFLPDREMVSYTVPKKPARFVFYPYINELRIEEKDLRESFPETWSYLLSHRRKLKTRDPVVKGDLEWWRPARPRQPKNMMRPKILTPHLVLVPRFSLDREGKYAISHAPFIYPKEDFAEDDLLRFFVAILNSTTGYWHIAKHSHLYQQGYAMLEVKTLKKTPVPDPTKISKTELRKLLRLVDKRMEVLGSEALDIERQIDKLVTDLYQLSSQERLGLGLDN